jgi:hypothetical protein
MKKQIVFALMCLLLAQVVLADGLSVQLKRTNPGIAGVKSAELIFDVVNMDLGNEIEGFLLCRSSDDVRISSTLGVGSGSGAQYVSPKFEMDKGPSQKSMSIVLDSETKGDMTTGCILKYIPFKTETKYIETYNNETNQTETKEETVTIYLKMNLETITNPLDRDYREIRLDKTVPFVEKQNNVDVSCPKGQTTCTSDDVEISIKKNWFMYGFIVLVVFITLAAIFMLGKGSRS